MTLKVVFRPQADQELQEARLWDEEQHPGLGLEFAQSIDETIERIVERIASNALAFPVVHGEGPTRGRPAIPVRHLFPGVSGSGRCHCS